VACPQSFTKYVYLHVYAYVTVLYSHLPRLRIQIALSFRIPSLVYSILNCTIFPQMCQLQEKSGLAENINKTKEFQTHLLHYFYRVITKATIIISAPFKLKKIPISAHCRVNVEYSESKRHLSGLKHRFSSEVQVYE